MWLVRVLWAIFLKHSHSGGATGVVVPGAAQSGMVFWMPSTTTPAGYYRMDGTNGTYDMRGQQIRGAGGAYTAGTQVGANSVDTAHTHGAGTLASDSAGGHTHTCSIGNTSNSTPFNTQSDFAWPASTTHGHAGATSNSQGAASHAVSGSSASGGGSVENRPNTRLGYWIQKT